MRDAALKVVWWCAYLCNWGDKHIYCNVEGFQKVVDEFVQLEIIIGGIVIRYSPRSMFRILDIQIANIFTVERLHRKENMLCAIFCTIEVLVHLCATSQ